MNSWKTLLAYLNYRMLQERKLRNETMKTFHLTNVHIGGSKTNSHGLLLKRPRCENSMNKVITNLYEFDYKYYLLTDYFLRYLEIYQLTSLSLSAIKDSFKSIFSLHGI